MSENTSEPASSVPPTPGGPPPSHPFFQWMRGLGITREPGWLGGVAAGLGTRLGIDPILVRGILVVVALIGAPALLLYAAAWLLLPDLEGRIHLERLIHGHFDAAVIGIAVVSVLAFLPVTQGLWFWGPWNWDVWGGGRFLGGALWNLLWTLAIIGGIVWLVVWLSTRGTISGTPNDQVLYTAPAGTSGTAEPGGSARGATSSATAASDAPVPPPATPPADADELEAWRKQQEEFKREHAAWKAQQAQAARERAAHERRLRAEQSAAARAALTEEYRRSRSHPLFSLVAIGVALVAGALSSLLVVGSGEWTSTATQVGLAVALGVLGLAVVVNGLAGKRQGGAGGMAWLVAFALLLTSWGGFAGIGGVSVAGGSAWAPHYIDEPRFAHTQISGDVDLNLADYFEGADASSADPDGRVTIRVISGSANIQVPADARTVLRLSVISGTISTDQPGQRTPRRAHNVVYEPLNADADNPELRVHVWMVHGTITVTQATE